MPPACDPKWCDPLLKNVHSLLGPDLLRILRAMGHGDEIAVVDTNFPAESCAKRLVRMDGVSATAILEAIISVMPIDTYVDTPVNTMRVIGEIEVVPEIVQEFRDIIERDSPPTIPFGTLARNAFYTRSREAFAIVATGDRRLYGNIILTKGVLGPAE